MLFMETCVSSVFREFITIANSSAVSYDAFRIQTVGSLKNVRFIVMFPFS